MAIKIPSKNIYEMNNPKIRDNVIDNVSVEQVLAKEVKEYQEQVYSTKIGLLTQSIESEIIDQQGSRGTYVGSGLIYSICSYISILPKYIKNYTIKFDKLLINKVINKVYLGKDKNENNEIKSTIKYSVKEYNASGSASVKTGDSGTVATFTNISYDPTSVVETSSSVSLFLPQLSNTFNHTNSYGTKSITADISDKFTNLTNLLGNKDYVDTDDYISFNIDILSAYNTTMLGGYDDDFNIAPTSISVSGVYQEYTADEIEISIYGDTIYLDLTDGSITYGSGNKPHTLSGNELMQDSAKVGTTALTEHLANNVLGEYAKGKETATLLCDINNYKNQENYLVVSNSGKQIYLPNNLINIVFHSTITLPQRTDYIISLSQIYDFDVYFTVLRQPAETSPEFPLEFVIPKGKNVIRGSIDSFTYNMRIEENSIYYLTKMRFDLHDEVIPYVFGTNGQDRPMSKYQDGTAKVFEVVGSNIIYDGAVWQELTLLEKKQ